MHTCVLLTHIFVWWSSTITMESLNILKYLFSCFRERHTTVELHPLWYRLVYAFQELGHHWFRYWTRFWIKMEPLRLQNINFSNNNSYICRVNGENICKDIFGPGSSDGRLIETESEVVVWSLTRGEKFSSVKSAQFVKNIDSSVENKCCAVARAQLWFQMLTWQTKLCTPPQAP